MADFIAVIRRAVDGLSNNTPEMRAKVYDKARSAVLRQLENMSPRPPEEMIRRQMDKLTAAIEEVETEHAAALPPEVEDEPEPVYEEPAAPAPEPVRDAQADAWLAGREAEPEEPAYSGPVAVEPEPVRQPEPLKVRVADTVSWEPPPQTGPAFATAEEWTVEPYARPAAEPVAEEPVDDEPEPVAVAPEPEPEYEPEPAHEQHPAVVDIFGTPAAPEPQKPVSRSFADEIDFSPVRPASEPVQVEAETALGDEPFIAGTAATHPEVAFDARPAARDEKAIAYDAWDALPSAEVAVSSSQMSDSAMGLDWAVDGKRDDGLDDDFDRFVNSGNSAKAADAPAMPPALDLLDWQNELASLPPLSGAKGAAAPAAAGAGAAAAAMPGRPVEPQATTPEFDSFDDLLADTGSRPKTETSKASGEIEEFLAAAQQNAYRREPKPRRNFVPLILAVAGLILVGGGAYAVWLNRDTITELVSEFTAPAADEAPAPADDAGTQTPAASAPDTSGNATTPPATSPVVTPPAGAPEEGMATGQKFTQRLRADGTEIDEGAAGAGATTGEGRSVSEQNVAPTGGANGASTPSAPSAPSTAPTNGAAQQGAFLYEERLGQASPTAITGGIEWTVLRENGPDGRPDPAIQGRLSIPERGLSALVTFRRNNDNSLPASHLVEIVFSIPPQFEGGAIESVQRVAMKRTEQDRGDPLVGVAAKVTDDTFLIALNDFADVIARNMDLLGTRNWIDIPVTYRNGRRALLTLDKGANGQALFQQVIREWNALGPTGG